MRFFKKKKTLQNKSYSSRLSSSEYQEKQDTRRQIDDVFSEKIKRGYLYLDYNDKAYLIAQSLDQQGFTKKELIAVGYRQIIKSLSLDNPSLSSNFNTYRRDQTISYITSEDKERYLTLYTTSLQSIIDRLESASEKKRQQIAERQEQVDTVENRLAQIKEQQDIKEKELDDKLLVVQEKIETVQDVLSQKTVSTPPRPDFDRLEAMLEQLRRLKNG
jgi:hypothetical protein